MKSNARRISIFAVFSIFLAISSHLFFGSILADANSSLFEIVIKDEFDSEKKAHSVSGKFIAPSKCHDVTVRTQDLNADTVIIIIETWEQPYRKCNQTSVPGSFEIVFFAPELIKIRTIVDGLLHPTRVLVQEI
jgi:hypothetical protein